MAPSLRWWSVAVAAALISTARPTRAAEEGVSLSASASSGLSTSSTSTSTSTSAPAAPSAPAAAPRFPLPFQLRPVVAKTLVRDDVVLSTSKAGSTAANVTLFSYSPLPNWAVLARVPYIAHTPTAGPKGRAFGNPLVGGLYTPALRPSTRLSLFAGVALPIGQGGGDAPDKAKATAEAAGIYGRAAMDNALWVVDYAVPTAGVGLAEAFGPCAGQVEVSVLYLARVRAENTQKDSSRTNLTSGAMLGCYVLPPLQLIGEVRYQRWLSTPAVVAADASKRDQATAGIGLRFDVRAGGIMLRPGVLFAAPIDDPMKKADYRQVMFDVPIVF